MAQWASTQLGQYFTKCPPWEISLNGGEIVLSTEGQTHNAAVLDPQSVTIKTGAFWSSVVFRPAGKLAIQLDGIPNARGKDMLSQVQAERARQLAVIEARRKCERFDTLIAPLVAWYRSVVTSINTHDTNRW